MLFIVKHNNYTIFKYKKLDGTIVETTEVILLDIYPLPEDCNQYFNDRLYLGIVDKYIGINKN